MDNPFSVGGPTPPTPWGSGDTQEPNHLSQPIYQYRCFRLSIGCVFLFYLIYLSIYLSVYLDIYLPIYFYFFFLFTYISVYYF